MKKFISIICVIFIITALVSCDPKPTKETETPVVSESVVETYDETEDTDDEIGIEITTEKSTNETESTELIVDETYEVIVSESLDEEDERGF